MSEITVTSAQNGMRFAVHVGDVVVVDLSENAAAGYRWTPESLDDAHVEVVSQEHRSTHPGVGSAGSAVWRVRAKAPGTTRVALAKSRPWESDGAAAERFAIDLAITA